MFGGAPELAQLLPHAPLEQLLAGGGEDGLEAAAAVARRVHRGGGFQNPSPRNPRSSPKRSRGRLERGARAGPAAATVLSEPPRGREPSAAWRRGDRLTRRQAAATRGDWDGGRRGEPGTEARRDFLLGFFVWAPGFLLLLRGGFARSDRVVRPRS